MQEQSVRRKFRIARCVALALIVLAYIALIVPIPINITADALEVKFDDPYHVEERTVTIRGTYRRNFFTRVRGHTFDGYIIIYEYAETHGEMRSLQFVGRSWGRYNFLWCILIYPVEGQQVYDWEVFGTISARAYFRDTIIIVNDGVNHMSAQSSPAIVLNASSHEEARSQLFTQQVVSGIQRR